MWSTLLFYQLMSSEESPISHFPFRIGDRFLTEKQFLDDFDQYMRMVQFASLASMLKFYFLNSEES